MQKKAHGGGVSSQAAMDQFDALHTSESYRALSAAGLVIGSAVASKVKIANTVTYLIGGAFKSKTTAEVAFTATTHDIPANAGSVQEQCYFVCLDGTGTATIVAGGIATGAGKAVLPEVPAGLCVIGSVRIAVAAGSTPFTGATTLLSAGALTVAYTDLGFVAPRFDSVQ